MCDHVVSPDLTIRLMWSLDEADSRYTERHYCNNLPQHKQFTARSVYSASHHFASPGLAGKQTETKLLQLDFPRHLNFLGETRNELRLMRATYIVNFKSIGQVFSKIQPQKSETNPNPSVKTFYIRQLHVIFSYHGGPSHSFHGFPSK